MAGWSPFLDKVYDPLLAGSIDGTDEEPHDHGIVRALQAHYKPNKLVVGDPSLTLFVARLSPQTKEETLYKTFCHFGKIKQCSYHMLTLENEPGSSTREHSLTATIHSHIDNTSENSQEASSSDIQLSTLKRLELDLTPGMDTSGEKQAIDQEDLEQLSHSYSTHSLDNGNSRQDMAGDDIKNQIEKLNLFGKNLQDAAEKYKEIAKGFEYYLLTSDERTWSFTLKSPPCDKGVLKLQIIKKKIKRQKLKKKWAQLHRRCHVASACNLHLLWETKR